MKKIYLAVSALLVLASCSKDVVSEKTNNNSADVSENEGLTLTIEDEKGNLISQEVVGLSSQEILSSQSSFANTLSVNNGGFVNPEVLERFCNPFDVAAGKNFEFVKHPHVWGLPSEGGSFFGDKNEEGTFANFIKSDYNYLDNSMVAFSPGMKYKTIGCGLKSTFSESAKKDTNGNYVFERLKDVVSAMNMTYFRDHMTCSVLGKYDTWTNDPSHKFHGTFLTVGSVYTEEKVVNGVPQRRLTIRFLFGNWVQDSNGPF